MYTYSWINFRKGFSMGFLQGIDFLIEKSVLVRWVLVGLVLALLITSSVQYVKIGIKNVKITNLESSKARVESLLQIQNDKVKFLGEETRAKEEVIKKANNKATKLALENKKQLGTIMKINLKGTCDEKVKQSFSLFSTSK